MGHVDETGAGVEAESRRAIALDAARIAADPLLRPEDIARRLFLKRRTVLDMLRTGYIPGFKVRGKGWRCRKSIYDNWEKEQHILIRSKARIDDEKGGLFCKGKRGEP